MGTYRLLIFDVDDTLVDFRASQLSALEEIRTRHFPLADAAVFRATYTAVNAALWSEFNRGTIDQVEIRRRRFTETSQRLGWPVLDWRVLGDEYEAALAEHSVLFPGVLATLAALDGRYRMAAVTNGLANVQRPKAVRTGLRRFLDPYVISEEEGVAKPAAEIFRRCLERAGTPKEAALMIGDSWESDGAGAAAAKIDFCHVGGNGDAARPADLPKPVLEIGAVTELPRWL